MFPMTAVRILTDAGANLWCLWVRPLGKSPGQFRATLGKTENKQNNTKKQSYSMNLLFPVCHFGPRNQTHNPMAVRTHYCDI